MYRSEKQPSLPNFRNNAIGIKGLNTLMYLGTKPGECCDTIEL